MARARMIKPGFFLNDTLAEVTPLGRLLFAGLWCIADRAGRLEDRPRKIKAEVLPYDDCDTDALLSDLHAHGFIIRYEAQGQRYIAITNFAKHQTPHMKETPSTIPAPEEHRTSTVQAPDSPDTSTVKESLNTEYRIQNTDPYTDTETETGEPASTPLNGADAPAAVDVLSQEAQLVMDVAGLTCGVDGMRRCIAKYRARSPTLDFRYEANNAREWIAGPANKKHRTMSLLFFDNWLDRAVKGPPSYATVPSPKSFPRAAVIANLEDERQRKRNATRAELAATL